MTTGLPLRMVSTFTKRGKVACRMTEDAVPEQRAASADEQALLLRLRAGEDQAFSELFELHAAAVRRLARGLAADASEAEDITAETFFRVLQALRRGAGPKDHVRAYLLTVARRVSWEWHGARRDVPVTDDELTYRAGADADAHAGTAERNLIATAFTSLPERWRAVLWQTEVEGEQPAVVAPHFGLSANATAALARRARQGLRAAYLQAHLAMNRTSDVGCRGVIEKLGGYTAGSVTGSEARRIRSHLLGCASCRSMHAELREVCSSLRAHAGALVVFVPATVAAAGAASGSGTLAALKGVLLSKLKVGVALLSTTAAGVVGITVGPTLIGPAQSYPISLPGQNGVELSISTPPPSLPSMPPVSAATPDEATLSYAGRPEVRQSGGTTVGVASPPPPGAALPGAMASLPDGQHASDVSSTSGMPDIEPHTGSRDDAVTTSPVTTAESHGPPDTTMTSTTKSRPSKKRPREDMDDGSPSRRCRPGKPRPTSSTESLPDGTTSANSGETG